MTILPPDPFPSIQPALLNSADIEAYAFRESVFTPFDPKKLKSASYEIPFEGDVYFWRSGEKTVCKEELTGDKAFTVKPNEIVFVNPTVVFRLPWYLALRFNLHISLVHRGLLLGTGPLVDPGFEGRLLIPLHNLTSSDVHISPGTGFIWIEVTKLSPYPVEATKPYEYRQFPENKKNRTPLQYFEKANNLQPITSTLRSTTEKLEQGLEELDKLQEAQVSKFRLYSIGGGVTLVFSVAALLISAFSMYRDFHQYVGDSRKSMSDELRGSLAELELAKKALERLATRQTALELQLDQLKEPRELIAPRSAASQRR
jgi:deoxycytidine triphosphate deaminase